MSMTKQEIFDRVTEHLLTQKKRSTTWDESGYKCKYRGPNGLKCAIGILIPDHLYNPVFDGTLSQAKAFGLKGLSIRRLMKAVPALQDYLGAENLDILNELQSIHDDVDPSSWRVRLFYLAGQYHLRFPKALL